MYWIVFLIIFLIVLFLTVQLKPLETFANPQSSKKSHQITTLSTTYDPISSTRNPISSLLDDPNTLSNMPVSEQSFVNFYCLGCRFTGFIGPFNNGFFDPFNAVRFALMAGCRTFVLEIDYTDECLKGGEPLYYPKLVIRDYQGKSVVNDEGFKPICNDENYSNIREVCREINNQAFANSLSNYNDPVIIVLYLIRFPPKKKSKPKQQLDYMSAIAKNLQPLLNRHVDNIGSGGTYTRQKQEGRLLTNNITDYEGRVLIFCNADTSGFRDEKYSPNEDLDYLVNLRLNYKQTKLGCTPNESGGSFGLLENINNYLIIPPDQAETIADETKLKWTMVFSDNPATPIDSQTYMKTVGEFGIHCAPIQIWNDNTFMYQSGDTGAGFTNYSFIPKPRPLRFIRPPVVIPAEPSPATNANQGKLRQPTV